MLVEYTFCFPNVSKQDLHLITFKVDLEKVLLTHVDKFQHDLNTLKQPIIDDIDMWFLFTIQ